MVTRTQLLPFLAGAGVVALFATSMVAVSQAQRAGQEAERAEQLEARVAALEAEVETLEGEVERLESRGGLDAVLDDLLGGLLGGDTGQLDDLLGGLLGGDTGQLGDLGDLGGLLDGLLGDGGGFAELFGTGGVPGADCLTPTGGDGLAGMLGGLLGPGDSTASDDLDDVIAEVTSQTEQLRELTFDEPVDIDLLDDDALRADLDRALHAQHDPQASAVRTATLTALRAIPPDTDLDAVQRELLDGQVAGYYVPDERRLVVRSDGERLSPLDRVVLSHELQHAVADQALGLPPLDELDADAALAALSLVEGDATLTMNLWALQHLSLTDQLSMLGAGDLQVQQEALAATPHHLRRGLLFPYTTGLDLVCELWLEGGWSAVDAAYGDLPATSAGVLWPDRAGEPAAPAPELTAPTDAEEATTDTFGAAELLWLLEAPADDPDRTLDDPLARAAAWAGGEVTVWDTVDGPVVGVALRDRQQGDPALCGTVTRWAVAATGATPDRHDGRTEVSDDRGTLVVACDADAVRVGAASTTERARGVVAAP